MIKLNLTLLILFISALTLFAQKETTWVIDKEHARIGFSVNHILISETAGIFRVFEGKVVTSNVDFTNSQIEVIIDVKSIDTDDEVRDEHLRSDDFFNAEKYPKIIFKSTSFKKISGKNYKLTGELTIRDVTKTVSFDVVYNGIIDKDRWGKTQAGFKLTGTINRFDYGVKWNHHLDTGGPIVGENVDFVITLELTKLPKI